MAASPAGKEQSVDLGSLSLQQLTAVKKQLDDELEHLTNSFAKLRAAQAKFGDCIRSIKAGISSSTPGKMILVPLTSSLYVPGTLSHPNKAIVDVGTGFYVEKDSDDAEAFYKAKVDELGKNLKDLEGIVQSKSSNLRVIEDILRQKVISGSATTNPASHA
ncbi:Prefoldin alpha subunit [Xylona heveae TC161]|uniref:Prefoldin alpha subunit n=1 Tax=Xylona heveae (strain CBS 132557 / TC161) TaxID=1328760 RepID=A0A165JJE7_XYLHT|nr:Prefoldin alpha subunit [Xylona heveae TC161]KZF26311.1 Prefoldin alpha subunit [Xylona heveae TC161]